MYAKINNGVVVEYPIANIAQRFPNISFPSPILDTDLPDGYVQVYATPQPQAREDEKVVSTNPVKKDGRWVTGWAVVKMTPEEVAERRAARANEVRAERNQRLAETDWRFRSDMTPGQEWRDYCQALRDISNQEGFPFSIVWPSVPSN